MPNILELKKKNSLLITKLCNDFMSLSDGDLTEGEENDIYDQAMAILESIKKSQRKKENQIQFDVRLKCSECEYIETKSAPFVIEETKRETYFICPRCEKKMIE